MIKDTYNEKALETISGLIKGKQVLFISTKNSDYLRNVQEINILKRYAAGVSVVAYSSNHYFARLLKIFLWLVFHSLKKYEVVFIGFAPQLILPFFKARFKHATVMADFFISMYDTMVQDRKKFKDGGVASRFLHKMDEKTIQCANRVICDTISHGKFFTEEFDLEEHKKIVLYLEADRSIYYPRPVERVDGLPDKFIVLYFGSILPLQGIEVVLEAIKMLENQEDIYFIVIGNLEKRNTKNAAFYKWMPQQELAEKIAMSDLCLAGHFSGEIDKAKRTIPGKAYIYAAMKKPMILGDNLANKELFGESNEMSFFVEQGSPDALAKMILKIYHKKARKS